MLCELEEVSTTRMVPPKHNEQREGTLAPVKMFRTERQANFRKSVRKSVMQSGKQAKDEERRRMEEYRKLCKKEGIQSSRLAEYDEHREQASSQLEENLKLVDHDQSLSGAEKRRRKFSMKQKLASTTVTEMAEKNRRKPSAMVSMEKVQATREAQRAEVQAEREAAMKEKFQRMRARREVQQFHQMKNRKGQPVMSGKVSALMAKIQNSK
jgi:hypothetical protein